jgi:primase-polymerase (primpol)-like protein
MNSSQNNGAAEVAASTTPTTRTVNQILPQVLVDAVGHEARWMGWKISGANSETKEPMSPRGGHASSTNPDTWADFPTALAFCERNGYALGLAITKLPDFTPISCVDFDHVVSKGAAPKGWAEDAITSLNTYTERSASGEGFKAFLLGSISDEDTIAGEEVKPSPASGKRKVEIFTGRKMVALTGQMLPGYDELREISTTAGHAG